MKDPAVLFYTSDFLTGTAYFTDAERGQYIRLLCEQHQNGHIPENHMVSVCLSLGSPVIKKFTQDEQGFYYNIRMDEEIIKRKEFTDSRRLNGMKGGRPKEEIKPLAEPVGLPTENLAGNENNITTHVNEKKNKKCLFENSHIYEFDDFCKAMRLYSKGKYQEADMNYYYECVKSWSESKMPMRPNWEATSIGFMLRDIRDNKFRKKR